MPKPSFQAATDVDIVETGRQFTRRLMKWNENENSRQMPWKGETDPYKIWLSEIILQQTRVEQGLKYYENFISAFPDVHSLAKAPEEKVFKLWEGLGYYSRCRNLISTAKYISTTLDGIFPSQYDSILELKGVGNYTASAIASFAYNLPYAVLDGNVFRVLSRIYNIDTPIDSSEGKKQFAALAQDMLPDKQAGKYNQAIMDFGATICKPYPECGICFFNDCCQAYRSARQDVLPVKEKKISIKKRWLNYIVPMHRDQILIRQRTGRDVWQQLYEFLLIETEKQTHTKQLLKLFEHQYPLSAYKLTGSQSADQKLTHQAIRFCFLKVELEKKINVPGMFWVKQAELGKWPFPKTLQQFIVNQLL
jgi:A/G-specific adenine glycosylase